MSMQKHSLLELSPIEHIPPLPPPPFTV